MYLIYDLMNDCVIDSADTIEQAQLLLNYYDSFYDEQGKFEIIRDDEH